LHDRVLARLCWHLRGQQSGLEGEQRYSQIASYRDGRGVLVEFFLDHEQALEALAMQD
jgi:ketosteroid isomerase-like protein